MVQAVCDILLIVCEQTPLLRWSAVKLITTHERCSMSLTKKDIPTRRPLHRRPWYPHSNNSLERRRPSPPCFCEAVYSPAVERGYQFYLHDQLVSTNYAFQLIIQQKLL